jgi:hypothetical protein
MYYSLRVHRGCTVRNICRVRPFSLVYFSGDIDKVTRRYSRRLSLLSRSEIIIGSEIKTGFSQSETRVIRNQTHHSYYSRRRNSIIRDVFNPDLGRGIYSRAVYIIVYNFYCSTDCISRFRGVVGYHVRLTRERSPVRTRAKPMFLLFLRAFR